MSQLWETAHESYVNDAMNASRMYAEICRVADEEYMQDCHVAFIGERNVELGGNPLLGDTIGHSFFQWDADSSVGVTGRVASFFETFGMLMGAPTQEEYDEAAAACEGRPMWPAEGSVFRIRDGLVAVKLSD